MWTEQRPLLEVQDLGAGHHGDEVVHGVSLHVTAGEIVSIVGPPGAGKSTLLMALYGVVSSHRGRVLFDDRDITNIRPREALRAAGITFVPQGGSLFPGMTVEENLELGMYLARDRRLVRTRLREVYGLFPDLADAAHSPAGQVDRTTQRVLELGRALMWAPRLALLDGVVEGLDDPVATSILDTLVHLNEETGLTVVMTDRTALPCLAASHRAYLLEEGRQTFEGHGEELLASPAVRRSLAAATAPLPPRPGR